VGVGVVAPSRVKRRRSGETRRALSRGVLEALVPYLRLKVNELDEY
jgi:hypothetical protein